MNNPNNSNFSFNNLDIKKLKGKFSSIIFGKEYSEIAKIQQIFKLQLNGLKKPKNGLEFLIFRANIENKSQKFTKKKVYLLGKIIAKNSSDFISLLANKLIKSNQNTMKIFSDIKLIQYKLNKSINSNSLIGIIRNPVADEENLHENAKLLNNFTLEVRKLMNKIVEDKINFSNN